MKTFAVVCKYSRNQKIRAGDHERYLAVSPYNDAKQRWQRYEEMMEERYPSSTETIALFDRKIDADRYTALHDKEGDCSLQVVKCDDIGPLPFEVRTVYGEPKPDSTSFPFGASFAYECEALAFAHRHALWNGGYSIVAKQPLSEAVA